MCDPNWDSLEKPVRAKILRILANYSLNTTSDKDSATSLIEEASSLDPAADDTVTRALLEYHAHGPEAALARILTIHDPDTLNLKLAILLQLGRGNDVVITLQSKPPHVIETAETMRLHALALLMTGGLQEAQTEVQRALAEKPRWQNVRIAAGIIDYFTALCEVTPADISWPRPVHWALVRRDTDTLNHLQRAAELFQELAQDEVDGDTTRAFKIWKLACLANNPAQQEEAQAFCCALIEEDASDPRPVIWASLREYEFDPVVSIDALNRVSPTEGRYIDSVLARLTIYLDAALTKGARKLLRQSRGHFKSRDNLDLWQSWHVRTLLAEKKLKKASEHANRIQDPDLRRTVQTVVLGEVGRQTQDWQPFLKHLDDCFSATNSRHYLYEACRLKAQVNDFVYVADRAEALLNLIPTPDVLDLVAKCAWKAKRPEFCLNLLNRHTHLFTNSILSNELRLLRIECQVQLGLLSVAQTDAESLAQTAPTTENLLACIETQARRGDLLAVGLTARRLESHTDLRVEDLLRLADLLRLEDEELATVFWRRATTRQLPDAQSVVQALRIGFLLGRDHELKHLTEKMEEYAAQGDPAVRSGGLMSQQRASHVKSVSEAYSSGQIPAHTLAEWLDVSLVHVFHRVPDQNEQTLKLGTESAVPARHGSRPLEAEFASNSQRWRLNVDITGLILSAHLGILDQVQSCFRPLHISSAVQESLLRQIQRLRATQPLLIQSHRQVLELQTGQQTDAESRN